jgi:hypothetical protein
MWQFVRAWRTTRKVGAQDRRGLRLALETLANDPEAQLVGIVILHQGGIIELIAERPTPLRARALVVAAEQFDHLAQGLGGDAGHGQVM